MRRLLPAVLIALLLALTACDPKRSTGLTPDSITITVTGLPTELAPHVTITGPDEYEQAITETTRLEELAPGAYTITINPVAFRENPFEPDKPQHQLTLEPGGTKSVRIAYAPHRAYSQAVLEHLNEYREGAGLPPVTLDAEGSLPNWLHARYVAENNYVTHTEDPNDPWYTPQGAQAGEASNVGARAADLRGNPEWVMHAFGRAPFHLMNLLDPRTTGIRHGYYYMLPECEDPWCDERSAVALEPVRTGTWPAGRKVYFPGDGHTIDLRAFRGEYPSPPHLCPAEYQGDGYYLVGLPLFVMRGYGQTPQVLSSSLTTNGTPLEHCIVRATTEHGVSPEEAEFAARLLHAYGATILLPREPLEPLATYTVTLTTSTGEETWTFHTGDVEVDPAGSQGSQ